MAPFTLTVATDGKEVFGNEANDQADINEASSDDPNVANTAAVFPLGTMGFSLDYTQQICP